jgi:FkbM family methyltransferase
MAMIENLIFDVGLHNGSDTAHYLQQGFRVVAIDANPTMVDLASKTFSEFVSAKRLILLNIAIAEKAEERIFWVSEKSEWSSFHESVSKRVGTGAEGVRVQCQMFPEILKEFGVPYYLKIDIEGSDDFCLRSLAEFNDRPRYISWEATYPGGIDQLRAVRDLGYTRFKVIRQTDFLPVLGPPYSYSDKMNYLCWRVVRKMRKIIGHWEDRPAGSSGPFGEATRGGWLPWHEVARRWRDYCECWVPARVETRTESGEVFVTDSGSADPLGAWFDFHASR